MLFVYSRNRTGPRTESCGTPNVTHVLSDRAPLTEALSLGCKRNYFIKFFGVSSYSIEGNLFYKRDFVKALANSSKMAYICVCCL